MQPCDDVLIFALFIITYVCAIYCIKKGKSVEWRRKKETRGDGEGDADRPPCRYGGNFNGLVEPLRQLSITIISNKKKEEAIMPLPYAFSHFQHI